MNRREWRWVALVTLVLVIASSLPYFIAWVVAPEGAHFTGLIFNPQDGNSYIAKMRQGFVGSWSFRLPYTSEPHAGALVYLFYLLLGHVARWMGLPLIVVYHVARAAGGAVMLLALYGLASRLSDDVGERRAMFLLAALGAVLAARRGSGGDWLLLFLPWLPLEVGFNLSALVHLWLAGAAMYALMRRGLCQQLRPAVNGTACCSAGGHRRSAVLAAGDGRDSRIKSPCRMLLIGLQYMPSWTRRATWC